MRYPIDIILHSVATRAPLSLPGRLSDTRDLTRQRHIPEHIPGDAEVTDISPGTARQLTTVMQSNRRRIPGQLIQRLVITSGFQSGALFSIFSR